VARRLTLIRTLLAAALALVLVAWSNSAVPVGTITAVNGFLASDGLVLHAGGITSITGLAHRGGDSQEEANARILGWEVYLWDDANGNGQSDAGDAAANPNGWARVCDAGGVPAHGWDGNPGELLLNDEVIPIRPGHRYLLLVRVLSAENGYTSLCQSDGGDPPTYTGPEVWTPTGPGAYGVTAAGGLAGVQDAAVVYLRVRAGNVNPMPTFPSPPSVIE
jgi:hypothetical protein